MRSRLAWTVVVATAATGLGLVAPPAAPAGCVGPQLTVPGAPTAAPAAPTTATDGRQVSTVRLSPGQTLTVHGTRFFRGCHDTGGSTGCAGPTTLPPEKPARQVSLTLTQGRRSWLLGTEDAGPPSRNYPVRWDVVLPDDLRPGAATLEARDAELGVLVAG